MKLSEVIRSFRDAGIEDAAYDARALFERFGGKAQSKLFFPDCEAAGDELERAVARRLTREPLGYILGEVGFYRETYKVTPAVLIPRQETELVVDYGVTHLGAGASILDLCTGSGCIALSVVNNTKGTRALGVDLSDAALEVAKENAKDLRLTERVTFAHGDLYTYETDETYDAVFANPPYIVDTLYEKLQAEVKHEPRLALLGEGADGAGCYRAIVSRYQKNLAPGGFFAFEIGYDQSDAMKKISEREGLSLEIFCDYAGLPRVAIFRKKI